MKSTRVLAVSLPQGDQARIDSFLTSRAKLFLILMFYLLIYLSVYLSIFPLSCLCMCTALFGYTYVNRLRLEWALDRLGVSLLIGESVRRGDSVEVKVSITNPTSLDVRRLTIHLKLPDQVSSQLSRELPAYHTLNLRCLLRCDHLNSGHLWGIELSACDPLGLMIATRRECIHQRANVRVTLGTWRRPYSKVLQSHQLQSSLSRRDQQKRGMDGDFAELREYQMSDPVNHVAWRASARRGKLLTRVFEQSFERRILIAVDLNPLMRMPLFDESRCSIALDRLYLELSTLTDEHVGVVTFDHRVLSHAPITEQQMTLRRVKELLPFLAQPLFYDAVAETQDELWERLSDYVGWHVDTSLKSGQSLIREPQFSKSLRLGNSFSITQLKRWLEERDFPRELPFLGTLGSDQHDHLLRYSLHHIGVPMTSVLPRPSELLHRGLKHVSQVAKEERATDLVIISHSQRLQQRSDIAILNQWMSEGRGLKWIQVGCINARPPKVLSPLNAQLMYEPLVVTPYAEGSKPRKVPLDSSVSPLIQWFDE